ncbi:hypothetical protein BT96DRAFT_973972 [Gymnopus androsaceus JB14]|uniref:Uncharacterized protein n=1 Tax=Gymnopus androsaceus JB14 TaxID=1447944 RepID=A0A6A4I2D1_9AGAR|nr:hypothetical protein BT96DRAFT_973972 [Gymnopus androsaceus JB14]
MAPRVSRSLLCRLSDWVSVGVSWQTSVTLREFGVDWVPATELFLYPKEISSENGPATTYLREIFHIATEGNSVTTFTVIASAGWIEEDEGCQLNSDGQSDCFNVEGGLGPTLTGTPKSVVFESRLGLATSATTTSSSGLRTPTASNQGSQNSLTSGLNSQTTSTPSPSAAAQSRSNGKVGAIVGGTIGFFAISIGAIIMFLLHQGNKTQTSHVRDLEESATIDSHISPFIASTVKNNNSIDSLVTEENYRPLSAVTWISSQNQKIGRQPDPERPIQTWDVGSTESASMTLEEERSALQSRIVDISERLRILEEQQKFPPDYASHWTVLDACEERTILQTRIANISERLRILEQQQESPPDYASRS